MSPLRVPYGYAPPIHVPYFPNYSKVEAINTFLKTTEATLSYHAPSSKGSERNENFDRQELV